VISLILACVAAVAVNLYGIPLRIKTLPGASRAGFDTTMSILTGHLITIGGSAAFVIFGLISTFAWARWTKAIFTHLISAAYGSIVRYVLILLGSCVVLVVTLSMLGFRVGQLVLGGTVTAVLVTLAAQQSLSNVFAGLMLQFAHPFKVGDAVWIRSGALAGTIEGVVAEISITYVTLENDDGRILLPNAQVLASAVSPLRSAPRDGLLTTHHRYGRFGRSAPRPPMAGQPADSKHVADSQPDSQSPPQNT
jgi:small-conductance mechanosensitive channel